MSLADISSSLAEFAAPHDTTTMSPRKTSRCPATSATTSVTAVPLAFVSQLERLGVAQQRHVGKFEGGAHGHDFRVGFGVHQARKAVAGLAADAGAVRHVLLVQHHGAGSREGVVARRRQIVGQLLDARLVGNRRARIGSAGGRLGRIPAAQPVHVIHLLGPRVIRLQLVVGDRPRRRDAVVMAQLAEILLAQPIERRAEHLGRAADEIVHLRLERPAVSVVPGLGRYVAVLHEHGRRIPVLRLALEPVAALENQDALSRGRELSGKRAAARAAADDDDVEALVHACSRYSPTLLCMMPPSAKMVVAVR